MRELVYLSERKLQQFSVRKPGRWLARGMEGEIRTPVGGIKINSSPDRDNQRPLVHLEKVISALESSDRAPIWYTDDSVLPGQWVHFEAPLNYLCMTDDIFASAVFFIDSPSCHEEDVRLVLHGSASHLVGERTRSIKVDLEGYWVPPPPPPFSGPSEWLHFTYNAEMRDYMNSQARWLIAATEDDLSLQDGGQDHAVEFVRHVVNRLDYFTRAYSGAWMTGYARVSCRIAHGLVQPVLVATPLYVEYADPPEGFTKHQWG